MHTDEVVIIEELKRLSTSSDDNDSDRHSVSSDHRLLDDIEAQIPFTTENQHVDGAEDDNLTQYLLSRTSTAEKKSTTYLDGLRGVAALCVFTFHKIGPGDHDHGFGENGHYHFVSLPFIRVFWTGGHAAVSVFFVLSGLVISQSAVKLFHQNQRQKCKISLLSATVRRPIRLYLPCLATSLIIGLLKHTPGPIYPELPWTAKHDSIGAELVHVIVQFCKYFNPFQYHSWAMGVYEYNFVLWTIPPELKGSMLVYALTALCCFGLISEIWSIGLLLCMAMFLLHIAWWNLACFVAGLMLTIIDISRLDARYVFCHLRPWMKSLAVHLIFFIGFYLISEPAIEGKPEYSYDTPGWKLLHSQIPRAYNKDNYYRFWLSYGSVLLVYGTMHLSLLQALLNTRPIQYLGRVSFMVYVVHYPLFYCTDRIWRVFGLPAFASKENWWDDMWHVEDIGPPGLSLRWIVLWTAALTVVLPVAHLCTIAIDEPSVRLGRFMTRKLGLSR